jgi:DNA-directed RNA polymerase specialized sigma24 family protein
MTAEEFGVAYTKGFHRTVRFLSSRGLSIDYASETAQAAWARGWEHLSQLRSPEMVGTWMNTIALNLYRSGIRREPSIDPLPELSTSPKLNTVIDARRVLNSCQHKDRLVLQRFYLEGYKIQEIAASQGWSETAVRVRLSRARRSAGKRFAA